MKILLQLCVTFQVIKVSYPIQCYSCIKDHKINIKPCPGDLETYPSSTACRISELADGTVIEQTVTPNDLCDADDLHMFLLGIARKYRVGDGKVACCYTNGCNKNIATALGSIESQNVPSPSQAFKLQPLLQGEINSIENGTPSFRLFWILWFSNLLSILFALCIY